MKKEVDSASRWGWVDIRVAEVSPECEEVFEDVEVHETMVREAVDSGNVGDEYLA